MLLTDIRTAVRDRITTETILDPRLDRMIATAVREYSRYAPVLYSTVLATVAGQSEYDLAYLNCLQVVECLWWPIGQIFTGLWSGSESVYVLDGPTRYHMPSERVINDINQEAYIKTIQGTWEQRNQTLVIFPEPTTAETTDLEIVYAAEHMLNDDEDGYDTIPDVDLYIIADLSTAAYAQARMTEIALEPDYAEGLQRLTTHFVPGNLRETLKVLRQGLISKYGGSGKAVAR